jgi:hypothetical protein
MSEETFVIVDHEPEGGPGRGRNPEPTLKPLNWATVGRPVLTTSALPPELLNAIRQTGRTGKAIELTFEGDPIGCRRVLQRLSGLSKRNFFGNMPLRTARRGGSLFVWLHRVRDERPKKKPRALPPAVTPPYPPTEPAGNAGV